MQPSDTLNQKTAQLSALLAVLYGECGEGFRTLTDEIQDSVLWLASDMAREIQQLAGQVTLATADN